MKNILLPINYFCLGTAATSMCLGYNIFGCVVGIVCALINVAYLSIFEN